MGKFPDYNDDGGVSMLDVVHAPPEAKMIVAQMALKDTYDPSKDYTTEDPLYTPPPPPPDVAGDKARADELLLQQSGNLTANPMPSMPSISNVGAAPFSGSINWNAIPGGFQPLPQVAGGKKRLYQLSKFHGGMNQKSSPRDISDAECQEATNVTVSQVGRVKLLGDITNTENGLSTATLASAAVDIPSPGYGLYVFKSGYSLASTPVQGDYTIVASTDGQHVVVNDGTTSLTDGDAWLTIANEAIDVAPTFYAAGNGLYAADANLAHTTTRKAAILVYREDINKTITVKGWQTGEALIGSPVFGTSANQVTINTGAHPNYASTAITGNGRMIVTCDETATTGNWDGVYTIYVSWLFDNGCETGLSSIGDTGDIDNKTLDFNVVIGLSHASGTPLGGDKRIHGARIYFREAGTVEKYMLAEVSLPDGIMGAADSTFTPWHDPGSNDTEFDLANNINFKSPPSLYTYVSKNGYYANEMYSESPSATGTAPAPHEVRYRTATIGSNGSTFIGCYMFRGKLFADGMMYSMPNKPGLFPELNVFDSPSSDGTPITALVAFKDKILQFKQDALYVINISNPTQYYTEASFRNCGVMNPCQTFQTPFGVIFANYIGCFIYDGSKVISLTSGKFTVANWGISEGSVVDTPKGAVGTHTGGDSDTVLIDSSASFTSALLGLTVRNTTDGSSGKIVSVDSGTQLTVDDLTGGDDDSWDDAANDAYIIDGKDAVNVPCVGYDPRSQSIIVLKDIGDDSTDTSAWIYHMGTQSWTEGTSMITNVNSGTAHTGSRHSNFIISPNGYLSICQSDEEALKNYNYDKSVDTGAQTITYQTKDLDFGMPTQTKKIFKIYVTYLGDGSSVTVTYGADGDTTPTQAMTNAENSGATLTSAGTTDHNVATFTLNSHPSNLKSIMLKFTGSAAADFEINDISILYRPRPIK